MEKFFCTAGPIMADINYYIDPLKRIDVDEMELLIRQRKYFVLHASRQTGKTTCLLALREYGLQAYRPAHPQTAHRPLRRACAASGHRAEDTAQGKRRNPHHTRTAADSGIHGHRGKRRRGASRHLRPRQPEIVGGASLERLENLRWAYYQGVGHVACRQQNRGKPLKQYEHYEALSIQFIIYH